MDAKTRKAAKQVGIDLAEKGVGHRPRGAHTMSLDTKNYLELKKHCQEANITLSDVVDAMIEGYLEQIKKPAKGSK